MKQKNNDGMTAPYRGPRYKIGDKVRIRGGSPSFEAALVVDYVVKSREDTLGDYDNQLIIAFENGNEKLISEERVYKI